MHTHVLESRPSPSLTSRESHAQSKSHRASLKERVSHSLAFGESYVCSDLFPVQWVLVGGVECNGEANKYKVKRDEGTHGESAVTYISNDLVSKI